MLPTLLNTVFGRVAAETLLMIWGNFVCLNLQSGLVGVQLTPAVDRDCFRVIFVCPAFPLLFPIGKHVRVDWDDNGQIYEIIGEVGDTIYDVTKPVEAAMYFPILSGIPDLTSEATIVAWTSVDPLAMSTPIQQQIAALEPELPVSNVLTMDEILGKSTATQGFAANLVLAFASLSLLLAAVGLYGVLSYLVTQRVSEIGIRIALGAQREQILSLILFDGLRPALLGLILGLIGSAGATQLIRSMLYGTKPTDPAVIGTVILTLLLIALFACIFPAWRASRLDPMQALRTE
jgi:ABC-type antimicrobial peptide transport system permease subunit